MKIRLFIAAPLALLGLAVLYLAAPEPAVYAAKDQPASQVDALPNDGPTIVPDNVRKVLNTYCADCHGPAKQQGRVRFDTLESLAVEDRNQLLTLTSEVVHFEEMPPDDKPQPNEAERKTLMDWLSHKLGESKDANLKDKMRYHDYGNTVDHDLLFSGEIDMAAYTPARRWLVSPRIFHERVMDIFKLEGNDRQQMVSRSFYGVTSPFVLPMRSGVRDYDTGTLSGGHLIVMLGNAKWIAERQILIADALGGDQRKIVFPNAKDNWLPRALPESYAAFKTIIDHQGEPTQDELVAAIQTQFDNVLQRPATDAELERYLDLLSSSIELGGNREGLRQVLLAVLLESEFLYRIEFGGGPIDEHGRQMLTPRELAYSIAYAIGDRNPDEQLLKAAADGRLDTRDDVRREVRRLLADREYFRGQVDTSLNGKHYQSNVTSHPKKIRFFRDFFGYRAASGVFKDPPRALGKYQNPSRGTVGSPGWLIREADMIVTYHVENDRDVFKNLLTSDKYFVYDMYSGDKGKQIIAEWREIWDKLKDTNWRTDPEAVLAEHYDFVSQFRSLRIDKNDQLNAGKLLNHLHYFSEYFPAGKTPFPRVPWSHGYYYHHSIFYSLPPTPNTGRYGHWKSTKYTGDKLEPKDFWDYELEQPFSIPNRKGILGHPAWLIAQSTNFHSDPIKRGRWIREKLLAGRVPDVPITVDAQVPEDPHRTFRDRVEEVTGPAECWKCHKHMNPLGLPFEAYDDFGRYRTEEVLEHPDNLIKAGNGKTTFDQYPSKPIRVNGALDSTGDPELDGEVANPIELIERIAQSDRARQSIIRYAFRFYMGRNESLADSQTLIDADRAYLESGGSFDAVIESLLTSDSFIYRKSVTP